MRFRRLYIRSFGKINGCTMELSEGINVLYGRNESGKTTFYHFLKGMLYGISRKRGRGAAKDAYAIYEPWEDPAGFGGIVWFEAGGKPYRLRRTFYKDSPSFELLDEEEGRILPRDALETVLGEVSEAVYENTVSIGQLRSVTGPDLARELTNYMAACQGAGDSRVNLERASQLLKMQRKGFLDRKERDQRELLKGTDRLEGQREYLQGELEKTASKTRELAEQKEALLRKEEKSSRDPGQGRMPVRGKKGREKLALLAHKARIRAGGSALAGTLSLAFGVAAALGGHPVFTAVFAAGTLACGAAGYLFLRQGNYAKRELERSRKDHVLRAAKRKERQENLDQIAWDAKNLAEEKKDRMAALANLEREKEEIEEAAGLPVQEDQEIEAINLALERITAASGQIRRQIGGRLRERTSEILFEITDGKYREILVDEQFHIRVNLTDRTVDLERLSRGTVEQIYFALRMASGELLCGEEQYPVILDDVFGMYDEQRLLGVLKWLAKQNRQAILFTCQKREEEVMLAAGIPFTGMEI